MFLVYLTPSFSGRGAWLIAIVVVAMVPAIIIGIKFIPPEADFSWTFALNLLFAAIGAYPFARYCERTKTRKAHDPKTGRAVDVMRRDAFCRIAVKRWPYVFLAGSAASVVWALYVTYNPDAAVFYDRGVTYYKKGEYDQAIADFAEAIRLNPSDAVAFNNRGLAYDKKGEHDRAIADYTEAIRLNPNFAVFNNRGFAYDNEGEHDRAIADYTEAIRLNPNSAVAFNNRGLAYSNKGEHDRAILDYEQAIRLDSKLAEAFSNRGDAYESKGEYDHAITDYTEAVRLNPSDAVAFNNRGFAYRKKGEYDQAIAEFAEAIRLNPSDAVAFNNRGLAYDNKGEHDRAIADYTEAIRLNPNYAVAFNNRGLAYNNKGEHDRAIADYTKAIRLNPEFGRAFRQRGYTHFYSGDFSAAAADLLRANQLADDPYAMLWRFLARGRIGEDGGAELSANAERLKTKDWPYPVIDFWLERRTLDEMRLAVSTPEEKCEAAYYIAEWHLLRGNKAEAKARLQDAVDNVCSKSFPEYAGAVAELKRISP